MAYLARLWALEAMSYTGGQPMGFMCTICHGRRALGEARSVMGR